MAVPLEKFVQQLEDSGVIAGETLRDFLPPNAFPTSCPVCFLWHNSVLGLV